MSGEINMRLKISAWLIRYFDIFFRLEVGLGSVYVGIMFNVSQGLERNINFRVTGRVVYNNI